MRVNVMLDDDLHRVLVERGGGPRKISGPLNELLRAGLEAEQSATAPDPTAALTSEVARLAAEVARLVAVVTSSTGQRPAT
jgi:hypothetical protein